MLPESFRSLGGEHCFTPHPRPRSPVYGLFSTHGQPFGERGVNEFRVFLRRFGDAKTLD